MMVTKIVEFLEKGCRVPRCEMRVAGYEFRVAGSELRVVFRETPCSLRENSVILSKILSKSIKKETQSKTLRLNYLSINQLKSDTSELGTRNPQLKSRQFPSTHHSLLLRHYSFLQTIPFLLHSSCNQGFAQRHLYQPPQARPCRYLPDHIHLPKQQSR